MNHGDNAENGLEVNRNPKRPKNMAHPLESGLHIRQTHFRYLISELLDIGEVRLRKYKVMGETTQMVASLPLCGLSS